MEVIATIYKITEVENKNINLIRENIPTYLLNM